MELKDNSSDNNIKEEKNIRLMEKHPLLTEDDKKYLHNEHYISHGG